MTTACHDIVTPSIQGASTPCYKIFNFLTKLFNQNYQQEIVVGLFIIRDNIVSVTTRMALSNQSMIFSIEVFIEYQK